MIRREGLFPEGEGPAIFWRAISPEKPRASLVVLHGYGDHLGRYEEFAGEMAGKGIATWLVDLRGHGRSGGKRGAVTHFEDYLDDVERVVREARGSSPNLFLLGHSHGGLVALRYLLEEPGGFQGLILSAPYLQLAFDPPAWKVSLAKILRGVLPWLPVSSGIHPEMLSRDEGKRREAAADPLFFTTATPGWFFEVRRAQEEVQSRAGAITLPVLALLPGADPVVLGEGTKKFFEALGSKDKRLITFPGALHEIFNELPAHRKKAMGEVSQWILSRAGEASPEVVGTEADGTS